MQVIPTSSDPAFANPSHNMTRAQQSFPGTRHNLQPALEELGDPLPALREQWDRLEVGSVLVVRYAGGKRGLQEEGVQNLLRLAGFDPANARRVSGGFEIESRRQPRQVRD